MAQAGEIVMVSGLVAFLQFTRFQLHVVDFEELDEPRADQGTLH